MNFPHDIFPEQQKQQTGKKREPHSQPDSPARTPQEITRNLALSGYVRNEFLSVSLNSILLNLLKVGCDHVEYSEERPSFHHHPHVA